MNVSIVLVVVLRDLKIIFSFSCVFFVLFCFTKANYYIFSQLIYILLYPSDSSIQLQLVSLLSFELKDFCVRYLGDRYK